MRPFKERKHNAGRCCRAKRRESLLLLCGRPQRHDALSTSTHARLRCLACRPTSQSYWRWRWRSPTLAGGADPGPGGREGGGAGSRVREFHEVPGVGLHSLELGDTLVVRLKRWVPAGRRWAPLPHRCLAHLILRLPKYCMYWSLAMAYGKGLRLSSIVLCLAKTLPHRRPGSSVLPPRVVCTGQDRCANLSSAQATGDSSTTMSPFKTLNSAYTSWKPDLKTKVGSQ